VPYFIGSPTGYFHKFSTPILLQSSVVLSPKGAFHSHHMAIHHTQDYSWIPFIGLVLLVQRPLQVIPTGLLHKPYYSSTLHRDLLFGPHTSQPHPPNVAWQPATGGPSCETPPHPPPGTVPLSPTQGATPDETSPRGPACPLNQRRNASDICSLLRLFPPSVVSASVLTLTARGAPSSAPGGYLRISPVVWRRVVRSLALHAPPLLRERRFTPCLRYSSWGPPLGDPFWYRRDRSSLDLSPRSSWEDHPSTHGTGLLPVRRARRGDTHTWTFQFLR
jgi:hypothetical protein